MSAPLATPAVATPVSASPWMWFLAGVMGTAGLGAGGAALYLGQHSQPATPTPVVALATAADATPAPAHSVAAPQSASVSHYKAKQAAPQANTIKLARKTIAQPVDVGSDTPAPVQAPSPAPAPVAAHTPVPVAQSAWDPMPARAACANCGTVESVTPIAAEGKPSGMGAVAGAVLGGLLGNQFGGGDGKTLATIGGVLGGAYAGNTVEKRMNQQTNYRVLVRMDDGSTRSLELGNPSYGVGARVSVQGNVLSPAHGAAAQGA